MAYLLTRLKTRLTFWRKPTSPLGLLIDFHTRSRHLDTAIQWPRSESEPQSDLLKALIDTGCLPVIDSNSK